MMPQKYSLEKLTVNVPGYKVPDKRHCRLCGKVMRPAVEWRPAKPGEDAVRRFAMLGEAEVPARVLYYGYGPEGLFCSLRCGYAWACRRA